MSTQESPQHTEHKHAEDTVTDPALNNEHGTDWTDEGGATAKGPATHTPAAGNGDSPRPIPKPGPPKVRML